MKKHQQIDQYDFQIQPKSNKKVNIPKSNQQQQFYQLEQQPKLQKILKPNTPQTQSKPNQQTQNQQSIITYPNQQNTHTQPQQQTYQEEYQDDFQANQNSQTGQYKQKQQMPTDQTIRNEKKKKSREVKSRFKQEKTYIYEINKNYLNVDSSKYEIVELEEMNSKMRDRIKKINIEIGQILNRNIILYQKNEFMTKNNEQIIMVLKEQKKNNQKGLQNMRLEIKKLLKRAEMIKQQDYQLKILDDIEKCKQKKKQLEKYICKLKLITITDQKKIHKQKPNPKHSYNQQYFHYLKQQQKYQSKIHQLDLKINHTSLKNQQAQQKIISITQQNIPKINPQLINKYNQLQKYIQTQTKAIATIKHHLNNKQQQYKQNLNLLLRQIKNIESQIKNIINDNQLQLQNCHIIIQKAKLNPKQFKSIGDTVKNIQNSLKQVLAIQYRSERSNSTPVSLKPKIKVHDINLIKQEQMKDNRNKVNIQKNEIIIKQQEKKNNKQEYYSLRDEENKQMKQQRIEKLSKPLFNLKRKLNNISNISNRSQQISNNKKLYTIQNSNNQHIQIINDNQTINYQKKTQDTQIKNNSLFNQKTIQHQNAISLAPKLFKFQKKQNPQLNSDDIPPFKIQLPKQNQNQKKYIQQQKQQKIIVPRRLGLRKKILQQNKQKSYMDTIQKKTQNQQPINQEILYKPEFNLKNMGNQLKGKNIIEQQIKKQQIIIIKKQKKNIEIIENDVNQIYNNPYAKNSLNFKPPQRQTKIKRTKQNQSIKKMNNNQSTKKNNNIYDQAEQVNILQSLQNKKMIQKQNEIKINNDEVDINTLLGIKVKNNDQYDQLLFDKKKQIKKNVHRQNDFFGFQI